MLSTNFLMRDKMPYRSLFLFFCFSLSIILSGCTTKTSVSAIALPELTFSHYPIQYFNVNQVEVINAYELGELAGDVSTQFPVAPDIAIRRYAENRLKSTEAATTAASSLVVKIEDASVMHSATAAQGMVNEWLGVDEKDIYNANIVLRIYSVDQVGNQSDQSVLTLKREMSIPASHSIAERELEQFKLIELLVDDVHQLLTNLWQEKFAHITSGTSDTEQLFAPELRQYQN